MEPRIFTEGERKSLDFLFDDVDIYDNYARLRWHDIEYVVAPIGDTFEYSCTSPDTLITSFSFTAIKEQIDAL
jgi:hypothetical protein